MQLIKLKKLYFFDFIILFSFALFSVSAISCESRKELKELVKTLYKEYPPECIDVAEKQFTQLKNEDLITLKLFFVNDLAHAIKADSDCADESGEICLIDFDILFDSQDSEASNVIVSQSQEGKAIACFDNGPIKNHCVVYIGVSENKSNKIFDIEYPNGTSLRKLLHLNPM